MSGKQARLYCVGAESMEQQCSLARSREEGGTRSGRAAWGVPSRPPPHPGSGSATHQLCEVRLVVLQKVALQGQVSLQLWGGQGVGGESP